MPRVCVKSHGTELNDDVCRQFSHSSQLTELIPRSLNASIHLIQLHPLCVSLPLSLKLSICLSFCSIIVLSSWMSLSIAKLVLPFCVCLHVYTRAALSSWCVCLSQCLCFMHTCLLGKIVFLWRLYVALSASCVWSL